MQKNKKTNYKEVILKIREHILNFQKLRGSKIEKKIYLNILKTKKNNKMNKNKKTNIEMDNLVRLSILHGRNEQIGRLIKFLKIKPSISELLDFVGQEMRDIQNLLDSENKDRIK